VYSKSADLSGKFWMIFDLGGLLVEFLALKVEKSVYPQSADPLPLPRSGDID
jgi:hypothetical protein